MHVSINSVAEYDPERTLVGCSDPWYRGIGR